MYQLFINKIEEFNELATEYHTEDNRTLYQITDVSTLLRICNDEDFFKITDSGVFNGGATVITYFTTFSGKILAEYNEGKFSKAVYSVQDKYDRYLTYFDVQLVAGKNALEETFTFLDERAPPLFLPPVPERIVKVQTMFDFYKMVLFQKIMISDEALKFLGDRFYSQKGIFVQGEDLINLMLFKELN